MLVHSLLIESVDLRRLGGSAGGDDFFGDNVHGCPVASREKKLGSVTHKGTRDSAADPASGSVDHRNLVLEHHYLSHFCADGVAFWEYDPATQKDAGRAKARSSKSPLPRN